MGVENKRNGGSAPRSIRQKRILDMAADHPDASMQTIAEGVSSATVDVVADILNEYGDPGRAGDDDSAEERGVESEELPTDPSSLTEGQRETLVAIRRHPGATQKEIGEHLGVARATVSNRVNGIPSFGWDDRYAIATTVLGDASTEVGTDPDDGASTSVEASPPEPSVNRLSSRVHDLERRFDELEAPPETESVLDDPALAHKVMHACLASETITESEELEIVRALLR